ncbi:MAG: DNA polymerase I, partial [Chloroflexi bacterium CG07_land_8_20_14_0_80_51_10]
MLLKTLDEFKPSHCAVAFDSAAPTFRHVQFQDYKAHRPKAPDELTSQFGLVRELVQAFNIPAFEVEGFEADDILGALSRQAGAQGINTIIITGDTDILQLVSPSVQVLLPRPQRPFSDTQLYDEEAVQQKYSLQPQQLADLKGLKGDPSDNIPGVPGIGDKTALKLIEEFSSIEGIYQRIDEVAPLKVQETLRDNEQAARQSKELATIVTDVPVSLDLAACQVGGYNRDKVVELFRELEFSSLLGKLPGITSEEQTTLPSESKVLTNYRIVDTEEALDELVGELSVAKALAVDTETTGKEARHTALVGISLSADPGKAWYIPIGHQGQGPQLSLSEVSTKLKPVFEDRRIPKITHNGKYDVTVLWRHGLDLSNLSFDTMIAAHLLGEKSLGLKQLAFSKLGIEMTPITELIGSGPKQGSMADVGIVRAADYACADADMTYRLSELLKPELEEHGLWNLFAEVEMPLIPVLFQMEKNGVALNASLLLEMSQSMDQELASIEAEVYNWVGHKFNINSTQQLGRVL